MIEGKEIKGSGRVPLRKTDKGDKREELLVKELLKLFALETSIVKPLSVSFVINSLLGQRSFSSKITNNITI